MTRAFIAALLLLTAGCSAPAVSEPIPPAQSGLALSRETYLAARARFRTNLIRLGPASEHREYPTCPPDAVEVAYSSAGGDLKAFASPVRPGAKPGPAVLFLHGGFEFGPGHWDLIRPFRDAGYVVLIPTLRGENGQPGTCSLLYDEVDDVLAAAEVLANRPDVDPTHLYLAGHSVGGTLTLLTALTSDRFHAAASFSAAPDVVEWSRGRFDRIPFPLDQPEEFRMRSAVAFATGFRCPVRLYFAEEEYWLQPATRRTALLAEQAGLNVRAVELPGGHDSANPKSIAQAIAFFQAD